MFGVKLSAVAALAIFGQPYTAVVMLIWAFFGLAAQDHEEDEE